MAVALPFHPGELSIHARTHGLPLDNPTQPLLTQQLAFALQNFPLLAIGTLDERGRPWTSIWGGEAGFARLLGGGVVGIRTGVEGLWDPVVKVLVGGKDGEKGEVVQGGRMVGGLSINLMMRKRVKLYGKMVAGALGLGEEEEGGSGGSEIQLAVRIEQSLGNCPKYLNKKEITPVTPSPQHIPSSPGTLPPEAVSLINKADLFFLSSSHGNVDMDTNHRGGPAGFVRVFSDSSKTSIYWPEYSGNRLYQTLGNLAVTPRAGLVFPDFDTGDVLYVTGTTETLVREQASTVLPRANLAVRLDIEESIFIKTGLCFRGAAKEPSPYNPDVWRLTSEGGEKSTSTTSQGSATLVRKTRLTPSIHRYRFRAEKPIAYAAGQWVALDFSTELSTGYSHMRDDDPRSLNDDFIRTFTVSNPPAVPAAGVEDAENFEFEVTVRTHGPVTRLLATQHERSGLEIPLRGFGGEFHIKSERVEEKLGFVAAGVGITPVLGQVPNLDVRHFELFWTVRAEDLPFVVDVMRKWPQLKACTLVLVTNGSREETEEKFPELKDVRREIRRMKKEDVTERTEIQKWFVCVGQAFRTVLVENWLQGKDVSYEEFY